VNGKRRLYNARENTNVNSHSKFHSRKDVEFTAVNGSIKSGKMK